jgi:hypothetical protein
MRGVVVCRDTTEGLVAFFATHPLALKFTHFPCSLPERVSEVGLMLWRTVDSADYAALADEMPELRPRGDPSGARRKY